jgi:beta-glucosidase
LDGEPIISSKSILTDLLRGELGFRGLTVTDYRSIDKLVDSFKTAKDMRDAGVQAIQAGMDMEFPSTLGYGDPLREAVECGDVDPEIINLAVSRVLETKFTLGLFERPYPERDRIETVFHQSDVSNLSLHIARQSMVLVKNEGEILPLTPNYKKLAVIGPNAHSLRNLFGGYTHAAAKELSFGMAKMVGVKISNVQNRPYEDQLHELESEYLPRLYPGTSTVYNEIRLRLKNAEITYAKGCELIGEDRSDFDEAVQRAMEAEIAILVVGGKDGFGPPCTTGEGNDSSQIGLPGVQEELVQAIHATGTPVVIIHMSARPLISPWISANIPAILEAWHPGESGDVLL